MSKSGEQPIQSSSRSGIVVQRKYRIPTVSQVKKENIDSTGKEKTKIANANIQKQKVVVSKTKWPVLQLIGIGVAIIFVIWGPG